MAERGIFRVPGDGGTGKRRRTARSGSADKSEEFIAGTTIISIVESRAREVCIAKLDTSNVSGMVLRVCLKDLSVISLEL